MTNTITCDGCGESENGPDMRELGQQLRSSGWLIEKDNTKCPACR